MPLWRRLLWAAASAIVAVLGILFALDSGSWVSWLLIAVGTFLLLLVVLAPKTALSANEDGIRVFGAFRKPTMLSWGEIVQVSAVSPSANLGMNGTLWLTWKDANGKMYTKGVMQAALNVPVTKAAETLDAIRKERNGAVSAY
jgi:uncharacterized membrane protein